VPNPNFNMPDLSSGKHIGTIPSWGMGPFEVWKIISDEQVIFGAVKSEIGAAKPVCIIGFRIVPVALIAKNALTDDNYQKKGIASELMFFVNKVAKSVSENAKGNLIISDWSLSMAGEALWNALLKSKKFHTKILYVSKNPTETFALSDIGKTYDGLTVISPKNDNKYDDFFDPTTGIGQQFFYILESNKTSKILENGKMIKYSLYDDYMRKSTASILQPYNYFRDGMP
jgi:hypothetical protein